MADQVAEQSVEDRMANLFGADAGAAPEPEVAQDDTSASEDDDSTDIEASADEEQPEQDEPAEDSDYEDIEIDGETFRVPPKIRESVLRQQDYTRKTQEVAETARVLQSAREHAHLVEQFNQATSQEQDQLREMTSQLAQYRQLDWNSMDSETMLRAQIAERQLRERASDLQSSLSQRANQFTAHVAKLKADQLAAANEYLRKNIPKFTSETAVALRKYAVGEGYTDPELESVNDPRFVKLIWKAQQYDTLKAGQKSAVEAVKKAPPVIKPGASHGQNQVAANQYKQARDRLRKSGSMEDAAALFMRRMK